MIWLLEINTLDVASLVILIARHGSDEAEDGVDAGAVRTFFQDSTQRPRPSGCRGMSSETPVAEHFDTNRRLDTRRVHSKSSNIITVIIPARFKLLINPLPQIFDRLRNQLSVYLNGPGWPYRTAIRAETTAGSLYANVATYAATASACFSSSCIPRTILYRSSVDTSWVYVCWSTDPCTRWRFALLIGQKLYSCNGRSAVFWVTVSEWRRLHPLYKVTSNHNMA